MLLKRHTESATSNLSLRTRIYIFLFAFILIILIGYGAAYWHSRTLRHIVLDQSPKLVKVIKAADTLFLHISSQRDFVPTYLLDQNPDWLFRLNNDWETAKQLIQSALDVARTPHEKKQIEDISLAYRTYLKSIERLIMAYRRGVKAEIRTCRSESTTLFLHTEKLAGEFKDATNAASFALQDTAAEEISRIQYFNLALFCLIACLLLGFAWRISRRVLYPLQLLAGENPSAASFTADKEMAAVYSRISGLLQNAGETSEALARSRQSLEQAERMVMVARLAASMAHSIRNPLTSVKMRLFSLTRTLPLDQDQQEDFDVISDEIRHLDIIVQNFLEFSRPPKLKVQSVSPSEIVDRTLVLLDHRFESYDVQVTVHRSGFLPDISGDPEQLKEVLVNIIENACQAMAGQPGTIDIFEEIPECEEGELPMTQIRLCDSGPGIPEEFLAHIFEPFYTTKGEGTGLGLSIAYRIISNHGGSIDADATQEGTCFTIRLPAISNPDETQGGP